MSRPKRKPKAPPTAVPKAKPPAPRGWRKARPFLASVGTLAVVAAVLVGLSRLGEEARLRVGERDRYAFRVADIDCPSPHGVDRPRFLAEVRAAGGLPETVQLLDPELTPKLLAAFAAHPTVRSADGVTVEPPGRVRVAVTFRTPVMRVRTLASRELPPGERLVDADGILLPPTAAPSDVADLLTPVPPPSAADGRRWDDTAVARAVEFVNSYHPRTLEVTPRGWRLHLGDGKVVIVGR